MSDIVDNYISHHFPLGSRVKAPHPDTGRIALARVASYIVTGHNQNFPVGVVVEFADNSMVRFEQGDIDHELIQPA